MTKNYRLKTKEIACKHCTLVVNSSHGDYGSIILKFLNMYLGTEQMCISMADSGRQALTIKRRVMDQQEQSWNETCGSEIELSGGTDVHIDDRWMNG